MEGQICEIEVEVEEQAQKLKKIRGGVVCILSIYTSLSDPLHSIL